MSHSQDLASRSLARLFLRFPGLDFNLTKRAGAASSSRFRVIPRRPVSDENRRGGPNRDAPSATGRLGDVVHRGPGNDHTANTHIVSAERRRPEPAHRRGLAHTPAQARKQERAAGSTEPRLGSVASLDTHNRPQARYLWKHPHMLSLFRQAQEG